MKLIDVIFAVVCGWLVAFLASDFLSGFRFNLGFWAIAALWILMPLLAVICLQISIIIGKRFLFVFQGAKFLLVGAGATVIDLKVFEILSVIFGIAVPGAQLISKSISFLISTLLKFWGNKQWAFDSYEKEHLVSQVFSFFAVTLVGLAIDVSFFFYFSKILGPQFAVPAALWVKTSVLFAALASAIWSFVGYKFFVFKK